MTKPMKYRDLARALRAAGFQPEPGKGDHEKWVAPDGSHVTIVRANEVSPGVTRQALLAIQRQKESDR